MSCINPVTLIGKYVRLEPLSQNHCADLQEAVCDGELYKLWYTRIAKPEDMTAEIERRLTLQAEDKMLPFAIIDITTNKAVGMTTYYRIDSENRRVEIGWTWYRKSVQRTAINTEAKYLLLKHAFEVLDCIAVELRTNQFNFKSHAAIQRLGARLDGVLRNARIMPNGAIADYHIYSIICNEWQIVKTHLLFKLW